MVDQLLEQAARKLLREEAGPGNEDELALGVSRACEKLAHQMANLVGIAGIHALFDRNLALVRIQHPWLATAVAAKSENRWVRLQMCIDGQDPAIANEVSVVLVASFLRLVGRFIGDVLVVKLLGEIWPDVFPTSQEKT